MPASFREESLHFKEVTYLSKVVFQFQIIILTVIFFPENTNCQPNNTKTNSPEVRFITPQPNDNISTDRPVIMIFLTDEDSDLKLNTLTLKFNGTDVTQQAELSQSLVTYTPSKSLKPEQYTVSIAISDSAGNRTGPIHIKFFIIGSGLSSRGEKSLFSGRIAYYSNINIFHKDTANYYRPGDTQRLTVKTKGTWNDYRFNCSIMLNTHLSPEARAKEAQLQPFNRYRFYIQRKNLSVFLGDYIPYFSPLTLSSTRIRGITVNWRYKWMKTSIVLGNIAINTFRKTDFEHADMLPQVTYSRYAVGIKTSFNIINDLKLKLNFIKLFDNKTDSSFFSPGSLKWCFQPKENLVAGLGLEWSLPALKTVLSAETAHSVLTNNLWAEKDGAISDLASRVPNYLIEVNNSSQTTIQLTYKDLLPRTFWIKSKTELKNTTLFIRFRNIPMQFATLGNLNLPVDTRELTIDNRWILLLNNLFFNIKLKYLTNNLQPRTKQLTTETYKHYGNVQYRINQFFSFQAGFLHLSHNVNTYKGCYVTENSLNYLNLGTTINFSELHQVRLNGFYSISKNSTANISRYNSFELTTNHSLSHNLSVSFGINRLHNNFIDYSDTTYTSQYANYKYNNLRLYVYYRLPNNKLQLNVGANINSNQVKEESKFRQYYFSSGVRARLIKNYVISFHINHALKPGCSTFSTTRLNFQLQTSF